MQILITGAFKYKEVHIKKLTEMGLEVIFIQDEREKLKIDVSEIEFVVCNGLFLYNDISKFNKLRYIQLTSAGMDRVPLDYITKNNIKIYNANNVYNIPIAEWTILKILEIYKKSKFFYNQQDKKIWQKNREIFELQGKTISILGYGNIGKQIAKRLVAFDTNIVVVDIEKKTSEYISESYMIQHMDKVLEISDIVILTLPLTEKTNGLINKEKLNKMKDNSILINVSRGKIINEKDLIEVLETDKFLGVILDVFEEEPLSIESKLWDFKNVIITPHNSFVSEGNDERLINLILENLQKELENKV